MKNLIFIFLIICSNTFAQKWTKLFDGKTLKGWTQKGGKASYTVEKGEIVGQTVAETPNSFLCTEKEYGDFILELDLKLDDEMNGGVQFRSLSKPDYQDSRVHGYQMEVDPSARAWSGAIYDEGRRDWLYIPNNNPEGKKAFIQLGWNKYRIEAIGNTLRTFINGVPTAHVIDDMTSSGFIALQVHSIYAKMKPGMKIRWKNIRIQTENLQATPFDNCPVVNLIHNNISDQEKAQGFKMLFNGQDFDGWRNVHGTDKPNKRWKIENGVLSVGKSDGSETGNDIVSTEKYSAFELVFEFKLSEGANSGLKYFVDEKYDSGGKSGVGLEYQILDDAVHPDAKMGAAGNRTLASLYDLIPSYKIDKDLKMDGRFLKKIGVWNQGRVVVLPNNIVQHWLNGFKVLEYERKSNIFKALVARSKYEKYDGFGTADSGHILIQDHGDNVSFKNIKIKEIK